MDFHPATKGVPILSRTRASFDKDKGFTLIELLVVILIIGILASIAIPILTSQRAKAVDASLRSDARTVALQMEAARTATQAYPVAIGGAVPNLVIDAELVKTSPHNNVSVRLNGSGDSFCVQVTNVSGTQPSSGFVWQNDKGGPQAAGADCTGYPTAVL